MQTLTEILVRNRLAERLLTPFQLKRLAGGSSNRRYGLVNRALKRGELVRLKRGLYVLAPQFRRTPCHPFAVAQALVPGSYVSFETALEFHGWIPEHVVATACVVPGRKSSRYEIESMGGYMFHPLAIREGFFLELVGRYQVDGQTMLVADPFRALLDLVCLRKEDWKGLAWIRDGLRVDIDLLRSVTDEQFGIMEYVYQHRRMNIFISSLQKELHND